MRPALVDDDGNLLEVFWIRFNVFPKRLDKPACKGLYHEHPLCISDARYYSPSTPSSANFSSPTQPSTISLNPADSSLVPLVPIVNSLSTPHDPIEATAAHNPASKNKVLIRRDSSGEAGMTSVKLIRWLITFLVCEWPTPAVSCRPLRLDHSVPHQE